MSEEQNNEPQLDLDICCPDENAKAEPYHAIMFIDDDGKTNGQLWGMNGSLMLFDNRLNAENILKALNNPKLQLRGVTAKHLEMLKSLEESGAAKLFVIVGVTVRGQIEAIPLAEHTEQRSKAACPPPMPPRA